MTTSYVQARRDLYFQQPVELDRRASSLSTAPSKGSSAVTASSLFETRELLAFDQFLDELAVDNTYLFNPRIPAPLTEILSTKAPQEYESVKREGLQFGSDPGFESSGYQSRNRHIVPMPWLNSLAGEISGQSPSQRHGQQQLYDPIAALDVPRPSASSGQQPALSYQPAHQPQSYTADRRSIGVGHSSYVGHVDNKVRLPPPSQLDPRYEEAKYQPVHRPEYDHSRMPPQQHQQQHYHQQQSLVPIVPAKRSATSDDYGHGRSSSVYDRRQSDTAAAAIAGGALAHARSQSTSASSTAKLAGSRKRATPPGAMSPATSDKHDPFGGRPHPNTRQSLAAAAAATASPSQSGGSDFETRKPLTLDQKRQNHISSEQKRRDQIKEGFADLAARVPRLKGGSESKSGMLNEAIDYVRLVKAKNETKRRRLAELKAIVGIV